MFKPFARFLHMAVSSCYAALWPIGSQARIESALVVQQVSGDFGAGHLLLLIWVCW
jgi:hypothetical protein